MILKNKYNILKNNKYLLEQAEYLICGKCFKQFARLNNIK